MRTVLIPVDGTPIPVTIDDQLTDLQQYVGGYIEAVHIDEYVTFWVNEEGIMLDLPVNRLASLLAQRALFGPVVVTGSSPSGVHLRPAPTDWVRHCAQEQLRDVSS